MTPTMRKARNEKQRSYNKMPAQKVAIKECKRRKKELKKSILNLESIAMENPNVDGYGPHGSILTHDWTTPEVNRTPVYIESTSDQIPNVETRDMHPTHITRRHHVTPRERHSLLARQNQKFESAIARTANGSFDEIAMAENGVIGNGKFFVFLVTNIFNKSNTPLTYLNCILVLFGRKYMSKPSGGHTYPNTTINY
jgi:hypothetical protein